jgi:hypothetical protein
VEILMNIYSGYALQSFFRASKKGFPLLSRRWWAVNLFSAVIEAEIFIIFEGMKRGLAISKMFKN